MSKLDLSNTVRLDRSYYSRYSEIKDWAVETFGPERANNREVWTVYQMFGYTTFRFASADDATLMRLRWPNKN